MRKKSRSDAMRALSDLYRIEAERIESLRDTGDNLPALQARLDQVRADRAAIDADIRTGNPGHSNHRGIPRETAWKILTVTFAAAGLAGFLTALRDDPTPVPLSATLAPLEIPPRHGETEAPPETELKPPAVTTVTGAAPVATAKAPRAVPTQQKRGGKRQQGKKGGRHGGKIKPVKPKPIKPKPPRDDLGFFDDCGLDPMCGFDKKRR